MSERVLPKKLQEVIDAGLGRVLSVGEYCNMGTLLYHDPNSEEVRLFVFDDNEIIADWAVSEDTFQEAITAYCS